MRDNEWLKGLKAGDEVALRRRNSVSFTKVDRVTATQILANGYRFRVKDGLQVGRDSWSWVSLCQITPDLVEEITVEKLRCEARSMRDQLPIPQDRETLEKFIEALKPFVKK